MNENIFLLSILLSSTGAFSDQYSTRIFTSEIGLEYEWNPIFKLLIKKLGKKWGYLCWILVELFIIIVWGFVDSLFSFNINLFFGLYWFVYRGLLSVHNFQIIRTYRKIGVDNYKKQAKVRRAIHIKITFVIK